MAKVTSITIDGKTYPCRVTMGAMVRYKRLTGEDVSEIKAGDVASMVTFLWCCVASACKADGVELPWNDEEFADRLEPESFAAWSSTLGGGEKKTTAERQPT